ncbi:MAG: helix-turn-helix domain-containing protein [Anaerolineae bacterium]
MDDDFLSLKEIAEKLKVSYLTVYRWVQSDKLPTYKIEKQYRVSKADFEKFLATRKKAKGIKNEVAR